MRARPLALSLPLIAAAGLLAACGNDLDSGKAEDRITSLVQQEIGAKVRSVSCPDGQEAKKGATFTCVIVGTDGSRGRALVRQKDDEGNVNISVPFVHPRDVEKFVAADLGQKTGAKQAVVTCPQIIVGKAGGTFRCQAKDGTDRATVIVTQTDGKGSFRYKLAAG